MTNKVRTCKVVSKSQNCSIFWIHTSMLSVQSDSPYLNSGGKKWIDILDGNVFSYIQTKYDMHGVTKTFLVTSWKFKRYQKHGNIYNIFIVYGEYKTEYLKFSCALKDALLACCRSIQLPEIHFCFPWLCIKKIWTIKFVIPLSKHGIRRQKVGWNSQQS